ncbi:unnamed protein product [Albugo candida]|uniref:SAM domain-containing protein n=1 Tax=Albugo candida TaxID=65357 RepID=A0A024FY36_9STRA|nr:unnamed protein product [Albugo candida]|eukprot:CCI39232.1 unnamed protein product [Albugo candida]
MSFVQVNVGSGGNTILEKYTLGDVLMCKSHRGKLQEIMFLLEQVHSDINYRNQNGCTALHGAAASGQLEVVQWMLQYPGIDPAAVDDDQQTPLHYAAFYGHLEVVQALVEHGVPLDIPDKFGRLAHCSAALNGHLDVVRYLLEECESPIDMNAIDEYGGTCLHWAASRGRKEVVQYLCTHGIDVHITSYDNKTAYQLAKDKHKQKCVHFLKSWYEMSQKFVHAAETGDIDELSRMIVEINDSYSIRCLRDKNGKNAIHWAAESGHLFALKLLCDHSSVWTDADKFGHNALHCAALGGNKECAFWLIRKSLKASELLTSTLTNKSPSRCAFEAGHTGLAAKLQAWEEGNDEYTNSDVDSIPSSHNSSLQTSNEDPSNNARDIDTVHNWLKSLDMDEYTANFKKDGFDTLRGVATIDENDLIDMQVKKGHRRVVLSHIEELRNKLAVSDEQQNPKQNSDSPVPRTIVPQLSNLSPPSSASTSTSLETSSPIVVQAQPGASEPETPVTEPQPTSNVTVSQSDQPIEQQESQTLPSVSDKISSEQ